MIASIPRLQSALNVFTRNAVLIWSDKLKLVCLYYT
jgi:hypothetical protein